HAPADQHAEEREHCGRGAEEPPRCADLPTDGERGGPHDGLEKPDQPYMVNLDLLLRVLEARRHEKPPDPASTTDFFRQRRIHRRVEPLRFDVVSHWDPPSNDAGRPACVAPPSASRAFAYREVRESGSDPDFV